MTVAEPTYTLPDGYYIHAVHERERGAITLALMRKARVLRGPTRVLSAEVPTNGLSPSKVQDRVDEATNRLAGSLAALALLRATAPEDLASLLDGRTMPEPPPGQQFTVTFLARDRPDCILLGLTPSCATTVLFHVPPLHDLPEALQRALIRLALEGNRLHRLDEIAAHARTS